MDGAEKKIGGQLYMYTCDTYSGHEVEVVILKFRLVTSLKVETFF